MWRLFAVANPWPAGVEVEVERVGSGRVVETWQGAGSLWSTKKNFLKCWRFTNRDDESRFEEWYAMMEREHGQGTGRLFQVAHDTGSPEAERYLALARSGDAFTFQGQTAEVHGWEEQGDRVAFSIEVKPL